MPLQFPHLQFQQQANNRLDSALTNVANQQMLRQDQTRNLALSSQVNQAFDEFTKTKDRDKFTQRMQTLGYAYGNPQLQKFTPPQYLDEAVGVYTVDPDTNSLNKISEVPKGSRVFRGPDSRRNDIREQREARLAEKDEKARAFQVFDQGGVFEENDLDAISEDIGRDLENLTATGRLTYKIDPDSGKRVFNVLPKKEFDRQTGNKSFSPTEVEKLNIIVGEHRAWNTVLDRLGELGITEEAYQKALNDKGARVEFQSINTPIGPISLPARFSLFGQYAQDPRYTAVKRDIELAFQAFRQRVTGAQASDEELKKLRPLIASLQDNPEVFFNTIRNSIQNAENAFRDRIDTYRNVGRDVGQLESLLQQDDRYIPGYSQPVQPQVDNDLDASVNQFLNQLGY